MNKRSYLVLIAMGKVISDAVYVTAVSESAARILVQRRIDDGEFYKAAVDVSANPERPLVIDFGSGSKPRIAAVLDEGPVQ